MELIEEKNPLVIESTGNRIQYKKNNVGRPSKATEIKFSSQPKSIVSVLLSKEKITKEHSIEINESNKSFNEPQKKKWKCTKCSNKFFFNKNEYKDHLVIHKNKVYKCSYFNCSYSTKLSSNLKTHIRTHTSEKPYACDECPFRSNFISSLKAHKRLHNDEKPYCCQQCNYRCNSSSNLKKHCRHKHSN